MTALLLPLAACGASEEEEAEAQAEAEALAESLGNAMDEAADEAAAEAEAEAEAEAAPAAAEGDGNTCEQAYAGILQMVAAMKKQLGGGDGELEEDEEKRA
ncbi:MAG: hypothetical protein GWO04_27770, partial [Actinobacteria bacterium]|nr:hypothetical protein [Actinomycetota bacterium]